MGGGYLLDGMMGVIGACLRDSDSLKQSSGYVTLSCVARSSEKEISPGARRCAKNMSIAMSSFRL